MTMSVMHFMRRFASNHAGVSALEFALIVPFVIGAGLFATSAAFKILQRQKLDSAVISTAYYLEDRVLSGDWEAFQPVQAQDGSGLTTGEVLTTARLVLGDAFKSSATLTIRKLDVYCGCPQLSSSVDDSFDQSKPFFTRYAVEEAGTREICSSPCADQSEDRILAEIEVRANSKDMFGEAYVLDKRLVTRLR